MKKLSTFLSLSLLLLLFGCQQELAEEDLIYRGDWDSATYALQIYSNGYGVCNTRKRGRPYVRRLCQHQEKQHRVHQQHRQIHPGPQKVWY